VVRDTDRRHGAVRRVVLTDVLRVREKARRRAETERKRGGDTPAVALDEIAPCNAALLTHHVQPERGAFEGLDRRIPVCREARAIFSAIGERAGETVRAQRNLAREIDVAGSRAAAVVCACGTLEHLHLLDVEHVAHRGAEVTDAVEENAVLRVEAAHEDRIAALRIAVLAELEGDARNVAQRIGEAGRALLHQHLLLDD
jgi:hypothetical protein